MYCVIFSKLLLVELRSSPLDEERYDLHHRNSFVQVFMCIVHFLPGLCRACDRQGAHICAIMLSATLNARRRNEGYLNREHEPDHVVEINAADIWAMWQFKACSAMLPVVERRNIGGIADAPFRCPAHRHFMNSMKGRGLHAQVLRLRLAKRASFRADHFSSTVLPPRAFLCGDGVNVRIDGATWWP